MDLSPHFSLEEMTASMTASRRGISNEPTPEALNNLKRLCLHLEKIRALLGRPITITSGYRSPEVNMLIGGSKNSQHSFGCAADIKVAGMAPDDVIAAIVTSNLPYDQLIREFDSWIHYSIPNSAVWPWRKQALIIDHKGARQWLSHS